MASMRARIEAAAAKSNREWPQRFDATPPLNRSKRGGVPAVAFPRWRSRGGVPAVAFPLRCIGPPLNPTIPA
eukprot:2268538-Prymnesium_polylepis.1